MPLAHKLIYIKTLSDVCIMCEVMMPAKHDAPLKTPSRSVCRSSMTLIRITLTNHHEQWLYRCSGCGHEATITVEAIDLVRDENSKRHFLYARLRFAATDAFGGQI